MVSVPFNVLASLDGRDVGMVSASRASHGEVELFSLWVDPSARGCGVGDALVEAVIDRAVVEAALRVVLVVREQNHRAIDLYLRNGFVDTGVVEPSAGDEPHERKMVRMLEAR